MQQERDKNTVIKMDETGKSPNQADPCTLSNSPTNLQMIYKSDYFHMASYIVILLYKYGRMIMYNSK